MIRIVYLFLAFVATSSFAQQLPLMQLQGKVTNDVAALEGIYVINKETEKSAITDQDGNFSIQVNVGDTLLFTATQLTEMKVVVTQKDFEQECLFLHMLRRVFLRRLIVQKILFG